MKWALVKYRQESGEKVNEGKVPMPFEVYCLMCDLLVCGTHDEYLFVDCFITLKLKLMARSENIIRCSPDIIGWSYDALIFFSRSKGVQEGKNEKTISYLL